VRSIVLYGAGSSILVDFEESCLRLGLELVAIVKNRAGPCHALHAEKVVSGQEFARSHAGHPLALPLFTPGYRKEAMAEACALGARTFHTLLDPTAVRPASLEAADGVYVGCGAVLGGKVRLDRFAYVNRSASLGHHSVLDAFASVGPGAVLGGHASLGRGAFVGLGARILPGVRVGANAVVAAGAVVTADVPDHAMVAGHPAVVKKTGIPGYNEVGV
jgi:carbonic anhydrase/acetyltransferase-like protein (isoleucine patch superfamily)